MAFRRAQVYHVHDVLDFFNSQHVREMHPDFGRVQQLRGVILPNVGIDEVAVEGSHSGDNPCLRPCVEVRFVKVFQELLQFLESGVGYLVLAQKVRQ